MGVSRVWKGMSLVLPEWNKYLPNGRIPPSEVFRTPVDPGIAKGYHKRPIYMGSTWLTLMGSP